MPLVMAQGLLKRFGGLAAVNGISLEVEDGALLGIMGPNGSGKTTFLNCLNGLYRPDGGRILLAGRDLHGLQPHEVARLGVGRTFQVPRLFPDLGVVENLLAPVLHVREGRGELMARARELLEWVGLGTMQDHLARELSGGQQKLLEFARGLMPDPRLLLLDEPFAGVHPELKGRLVERILDLNRQGKTALIVSHDVASLYALARRVVVFHNGQLIASGTAREIEANPAVLEAYFGA